MNMCSGARVLGKLVGEMDLADVWIVGCRAQGDYVVDGFEVEIGIPCLDQSVHARANDVLGDSIFPSAGAWLNVSRAPRIVPRGCDVRRERY